MSCGCAADWRLDVIDLASGKRVRSLPFLSFQFDDLLNTVGPAQIRVPVDKVSTSDIWPHLRAVVFTRTDGPSATPSSPVAEYIGMIETAIPTSDGYIDIGLQSIEYYLNYRVIVSDTTYTSTDQNAIGGALVGLASTDGINIAAGANPSSFPRTRAYLATDDKSVLQAIQELCALDDGPDYQRIFVRDGSFWNTTLLFTDYLGSGKGSLNALRGVVKYGVTIDGTQHANWIRGRGDNALVDTNDATADSIYARFDRAIQWSDVNDALTLQGLVDGSIFAFADPSAVPDVTVANLATASRFSNGDTVLLNINQGANRYHGDARVIGKSWSVGVDQPSLCTFSFTPSDVSSASEAILNAPPSPDRGCC